MKNIIRISTFFFALCLSLVLGSFRIATANAAYDPNNIIRDDLFIDSTSMNQADIQAFLSAHGSCLASVDTSLLGAGNAQSAAAIIYQAATNSRYPVSPKVLLTTMQKEWSLLTKSCAQLDAYAAALGAAPHAYLDQGLGYDVPDVLGIGSCLYSFNNQLLGATCSGSNYLGSAGSFRKNWNNGTGGGGAVYPAQFNVQQCSTQLNIAGTPCGASDWGKTITITPQTKATSILYRYTPYAYFGNYNFYNIYNTFFPPAAYSSSWESQSNIPALNQGQSTTVSIRIKNHGYVTWLNTGANPVKLATASPDDRTSQFSDSSWPGVNRPSFLASTEAGDSIESVDAGKVKPGQVAVFTFTITAQTHQAAGTYREFFSPILEGLPGAINLGGIFFDVTVLPSFNAQWNDQSAFPTITSGKTARAYIKYQNTGNTTWSNTGATPVRLATARTFGRSSTFATSDWINNSSSWRPGIAGSNGSFVAVEAGSSNASIDPTQVKPGQIGTFAYDVTAFDSIPVGSYMEYFTLSQDGSTGYGQFGPDDVYNKITTTYRWDSTWAGQTPFISIGSGQYSSVTIKMRNTGTSTWSNTGANPVLIATSRGYGRSSIFQADGWNSGSDITTFSSTEVGTGSSTIIPGQVGPNQIGDFTFLIKTHAWIPKGSYMEYYGLEQTGANGVGTFGPDDTYEKITIMPDWVSKWVDQSPFPTVAIGTFGTITIKMQNTGGAVWSNSGPNPVNMATVRPFNRGSNFVIDSWISPTRPTSFTSTELGAYGDQTITPGLVKPGQIGVFTFTFKAHAWIGTGSFIEYFGLAQDGPGGTGQFGPDDTYVKITSQ